jgi:transcriptional regulator with XRE-family HTH domain
MNYLAKVLTIMSREKIILLPVMQRILAEMGENIRLARLRRRFSASIVAQRAGIARNTLRAIERGDASVTFGAYASVIFSLGLENDFRLLARDDVLGRKLQDAGLTVKARAPRKKTSNSEKSKKDE